MNPKLYLRFIIFTAGMLSLVCCGKEDVESEADSIRYTIVNNSDFEPTVMIEYTDENGTDMNVTNPTLPWEVNFRPNFTKPQLLQLNASCDCEMTARILHNGIVVNDSTGSSISIDYTYQ